MSHQRSVTDDDFELTHWRRLLRRRWPVVLLVGLLGGALALAGALRGGATYRATATLALQAPLSQSGGTGPTADQVQAEVDLASTAVVKGGVPGVRDGRVTLSATTTATSGILNLVAEASTADGAAKAANAYAASYQKVKRTSLVAQYDAAIGSLQTALTSLQAQRDAALTDAARAPLDSRIKTLAASVQDFEVRRELAPSELPQVVQGATPPGQPVPRQLATYVLIGLVAGLVVGVGAAAAVEHADDTIRDTEGLVEAYRRSDLTLDVTPPLVVALPPPVGAEGRGRRRLRLSRQRSVDAAALHASNWYAMLRSALDSRLVDGERGVVLVTSATGEDGACGVAARLAAAFARARGQAVLLGLDDGDGVLALTGLLPSRAEDASVADVLTGQAVLSEALVRAPGQAELLVGSAGAGPLPLDLLGSAAGAQLLEELRRAVAVTVVALPGVASEPGATVLATMTDHVVLVARAGVTRRREVRAALDGLFQVGAPVTALVLADVPALEAPQPSRQAPTGVGAARSQVL